MLAWTTTQYLTSALKKLGYLLPHSFVAFIVLSVFWQTWLFVLVLITGYLLFKDTLNLVQAVGPVYWISRDYEKSQGIKVNTGFMREIDSPWRMGKGIQVSIHKRSFQLGLCRKTPYKDIQEAELGVLGARFMDTEPTEIGYW